MMHTNSQEESLLVLVHDDKASAITDAALVVSDSVSIGTNLSAWIDTPHFCQKANLIVVDVGSEMAAPAALEDVQGAQFGGG
jgi:hypothetical protein